MDEDALYRSIRERLDCEVGELKNRRSASLAPERLFHYTNLEALLSIVASGRMRASNCMFLNDAAEIRYSRQLLDREVPAAVPSPENPREIRRLACDVFDEVLAVVSPTVFVLSLSFEGDSLSLWNGYGLESSCALGFDWRALFRILFPKTPAQWLADPQPPYPPKVSPVLYDRGAQVDTIRAYIRILSDCYQTAAAASWPPEVLRKCFGHVIMDLLMFAIACKASAHEYEREYRVAFSLAPKEMDTVRYRVRRDVVVPYIEVDLRGGDGLLPLSQIWVGPRNRTDMACHGVRAFLSSHGYSNVGVLRSSLDLRF